MIKCWWKRLEDFSHSVCHYNMKIRLFIRFPLCYIFLCLFLLTFMVSLYFNKSWNFKRRSKVCVCSQFSEVSYSVPQSGRLPKWARLKFHEQLPLKHNYILPISLTLQWELLLAFSQSVLLPSPDTFTLNKNSS